MDSIDQMLDRLNTPGSMDEGDVIGDGNGNGETEGAAGASHESQTHGRLLYEPKQVIALYRSGVTDPKEIVRMLNAPAYEGEIRLLLNSLDETNCPFELTQDMAALVNLRMVRIATGSSDEILAANMCKFLAARNSVSREVKYKVDHGLDRQPDRIIVIQQSLEDARKKALAHHSTLELPNAVAPSGNNNDNEQPKSNAAAV